MSSEDVTKLLSGQRVGVVYRLSGSQAEAYEAAKGICLEQTVEFPDDLVPLGPIRDSIVGQLESFEKLSDGTHAALITYAEETTAGELTQFLNVMFGNSSIKPGIRVEELRCPDNFLQRFRGPRFGITGLRAALRVPERPLLQTALKPMGLSSRELASLARACALGGIDIIKDDHGLTNQPFAPFTERVRQCVAAINEANAESGGTSIYVANVTAGESDMMDRARLARDLGAGGLLVAPGLTGWDAMRRLAEDDSIALPIICHPAFLGSLVTSPTCGISHYALFGQLVRLAGGDATIFPNFGGRFSFSREECESIAAGATISMGPLNPIFPSPGGGMSLASVPESLGVYGRDVIFLVGGGLFKHGPDVTENARHFRELVR